MNILISPDSFKGSLSSLQAAKTMEKACRKILPKARIELLPIADGGEGTIEVIKRISGGTFYKEENILDPLGRHIQAKWLKQGNCAFLEMAQSSGLILLKEKERNPLKTTTFGVGQLICKAIQKGCRRIYLGIGGSATNDGGIGALTALGVRFLTGNNRRIYPGTGKDLLRIKKIDFAGIPKEILSAEFIILSDVKNPLCGRYGAAYVYAPQKGANEKTTAVLDNGLRHYAELIKKHTGKDIKRIPGSGAAGGIGAGLYSFLNAGIVSGIKTILEIGKFEQKLQKTDLLLTGEGQIDSQIKHGKALGVIFQLCEKYKIPAIAFAGTVDTQFYTSLKTHRISAVSIVPGIIEMSYAQQNAKKLLMVKTEQMLKVYRYSK